MDLTPSASRPPGPQAATAAPAAAPRPGVKQQLLSAIARQVVHRAPLTPPAAHGALAPGRTAGEADAELHARLQCLQRCQRVPGLVPPDDTAW